MFSLRTKWTESHGAELGISVFAWRAQMSISGGGFHCERRPHGATSMDFLFQVIRMCFCSTSGIFYTLQIFRNISSFILVKMWKLLLTHFLWKIWANVTGLGCKMYVTGDIRFWQGFVYSWVLGRIMSWLVRFADVIMSHAILSNIKQTRNRPGTTVIGTLQLKTKWHNTVICLFWPQPLQLVYMFRCN